MLKDAQVNMTNTTVYFQNFNMKREAQEELPAGLLVYAQYQDGSKVDARKCTSDEIRDKVGAYCFDNTDNMNLNMNQSWSIVIDEGSVA